MDSPRALDRDGEWYLRGWRDALEGIAAMASPKGTATSAHHALEAIREHCDVMLAKAHDVAAARVKLPPSAKFVQARLFGDSDG